MKAGARVFLEGANEIRYTMPSGIVVAGKPDLISVESGHPTIYDVKTGQQKACNEVQVMLYMLLLPKSVPAYHGSCPSGCVLYSAGAVSIPPEAIDETFVKHFEYFVDVIGSEVPAMKAPSRSECRFCDVSKSECAERVDA